MAARSNRLAPFEAERAQTAGRVSLGIPTTAMGQGVTKLVSIFYYTARQNVNRDLLELTVFVFDVFDTSAIVGPLGRASGPMDVMDRDNGPRHCRKTAK
jgi:hypothetical protein